MPPLTPFCLVSMKVYIHETWKKFFSFRSVPTNKTFKKLLELENSLGFLLKKQNVDAKTYSEIFCFCKLYNHIIFSWKMFPLNFQGDLFKLTEVKNKKKGSSV